MLSNKDQKDKYKIERKTIRQNAIEQRSNIRIILKGGQQVNAIERTSQDKNTIERRTTGQNAIERRSKV